MPGQLEPWGLTLPPLSLQSGSTSWALGLRAEEAKAWRWYSPSVLLSAAVKGWKEACVYIKPATLSRLQHVGALITKHYTRCFPQPQNSHVILLFSSSVRVEVLSSRSGWRYVLTREELAVLFKSRCDSINFRNQNVIFWWVPWSLISCKGSNAL